MSESKQFVETLENVEQIYWVACGGSVIDLYPAHVYMVAHAKAIESKIETAAEFLTFTPAALGKNSVVVVCSHSGKTPEALDACKLAQSKGARVIAMTHQKGSAIDSGSWPCWVYSWEDDTPQAGRPAGFSLTLAAELIAQTEGVDVSGKIEVELAKLDAILPEAKAKATRELGPKFVEFCQKNSFFYILGSGPTFCQTYGFAICSMMEMQWQNCSYINSAEYFHGPLEVTEPGVAYFLQKSSGKARKIDERAETFLSKYTDTLFILDANDFGIDTLDAELVSYLEPIFFYEMNVTLREERGKAYNHHPDTRRYMGKVSY